jgi:hypothetical protein
MVSWTVIAGTGERFSDFAPYVPSVNDKGTVAFQAACGAEERASSPAAARQSPRPRAPRIWPPSQATPT